MPIRSLPFRLLAVVCAVVQMLLPAMAAVADGVKQDAGRVAAHAQVRVEQHSERACVPLTTDACAFCEILAHRGAPSDPPCVPQWQREGRTDGRGAAHRRSGRVARRRHRPSSSTTSRLSARWTFHAPGCGTHIDHR